MNYTATWKTGFYRKADAQKVADEIRSIGESAKPEQIVKKAEEKNTELHQLFEWDNEKAGHKYRLQQARHIVQNLVIVKEKESGIEPEVTNIRVFYQEDEKTGYKPTEVIIKNPDSYEKLLNQALLELKAFEKKYHALTELNEIFEQIHYLIA